MNLSEVLRDDSHRELNLPPSLGPFLSDGLLPDDGVQSAEGHDADDRHDGHCHQQLDERKSALPAHPPAPIPAGASQRSGTKPGGGGGSSSAETV